MAAQSHTKLYLCPVWEALLDCERDSWEEAKHHVACWVPITRYSVITVQIDLYLNPLLNRRIMPQNMQVVNGLHFSEASRNPKGFYNGLLFMHSLTHQWVAADCPIGSNLIFSVLPKDTSTIDSRGSFTLNASIGRFRFRTCINEVSTHWRHLGTSNRGAEKKKTHMRARLLMRCGSNSSTENKKSYCVLQCLELRDSKVLAYWANNN